MPAMHACSHWCCIAAMCAALCGASGCTWIAHLGCDPSGEEYAKTFYVGGAGTLGHIGTIDVPRGLRRGGFRGAIEVFGWQSWVGGTIRDQIDSERNQQQALELAGRIEEYKRRQPARPVNIIALSAGTGIATWAIENLPEDVNVASVVFFGSSLSRDYDLAAALMHVDGVLYNFYSPADPVLRLGVPITGSVDREFEGPGVAGLFGFAAPDEADDRRRRLYAAHLCNLPWRRHFARAGYRGLHTDATSPAFIAEFVVPLLETPLRRREADSEQPTTRPASTAPATSRPT